MPSRVLKAVLLVTLLFLFLTYFIGLAHAAEPKLVDIFDHLGFTNVEEENGLDFTFPAGVYNITLYAEFAAYHDGNELSYYQAGTNTYNVIFTGPEGNCGYIVPPITKTVAIDYEFGFSMLVTNENHRYFSENSLNPDGQRHFKIYQNLNDPTMFLFGFENLYGAGDRDYQDLVLSLQIQVPHNVVPEVPFGTIMTVACMLIALVGYKQFRPKLLSRL